MSQYPLMEILKAQVEKDIASEREPQVCAFAEALHVALPVEACIKKVVQPNRNQGGLRLGVIAEPESEALVVYIGLPHKSHIRSILPGESRAIQRISEVPSGIVPDEGIAESVLSSI